MKRVSTTLAVLAIAALSAAILSLTENRTGNAAPNAGATAVFAGGCFWSVEKTFDAVDGVTETVSGYAGGTKPNPTYGDHEGYVEAVKVTYDPAKVSYAKLLDAYWHSIDPFNARGQFCDEGPAYRTVIFTGTEDEVQQAKATKQEISDRFRQGVTTDVKPATTFVAAEDYHQNYHTLNPVRYELYKRGCGRVGRLAEIWGEKSS